MQDRQLVRNLTTKPRQVERELEMRKAHCRDVRSLMVKLSGLTSDNNTFRNQFIGPVQPAEVPVSAQLYWPSCERRMGACQNVALASVGSRMVTWH